MNSSSLDSQFLSHLIFSEKNFIEQIVIEMLIMICHQHLRDIDQEITSFFLWILNLFSYIKENHVLIVNLHNSCLSFWNKIFPCTFSSILYHYYSRLCVSQWGYYSIYTKRNAWSWWSKHVHGCSSGLF